MAIDRYRAGEQQLAAEKRSQQFPGLEVVMRLASKGASTLGIELPKFIELCSEAVQRNSTGNLSYLLECLAGDVERLDLKFEAFESAGQAEREALDELISEAAVRAAEAKSKDRVKRVARILVNAFRSGPKRDYEQERELIDTAVQLADSDAVVLGVIMKYFGPVVRRAGVADINETNQAWKKMREENAEFQGTHIHVSCARLQAHGLIIQMDRNPMSTDLATNVYSLTEYGLQFCDWCIVEDQCTASATHSRPR
jgi:hypothetical protein